MSAEIVGPFHEYDLIVDGYSVPFVQAQENDGGTVTFIMDRRLAWTVPSAVFEDVSHLIATAYALGIGLPCAPSSEYEPEQGDYCIACVPAAMRPRRTLEITSVRREEPEDGSSA